MIIGTIDAVISCWDLRFKILAYSCKFTDYSNSQIHKITSFFDPTLSHPDHIILQESNGKMTVWDVRSANAVKFFLNENSSFVLKDKIKIREFKQSINVSYTKSIMRLGACCIDGKNI